jgi:hypothetical protein
MSPRIARHFEKPAIYRSQRGTIDVTRFNSSIMKIDRHHPYAAITSLAILLTLPILSSCSSRSEKIIGYWETKYECKSKKGEIMSYSGVQAFSKSQEILENGRMKIQSTSPQGQKIEATLSVNLLGVWEIDNDRINFSLNSFKFHTREIMIDSSLVYSLDNSQISSNPQIAAAAESMANAMTEQLRKRPKFGYQIARLDDEKFIVKDTSTERADNFDPGVCETIEYGRTSDPFENPIHLSRP